MMCIPIPSEKSDTLLEPTATQEIGIVYSSHKLLGEIYSDVVKMP